MTTIKGIYDEGKVTLTEEPPVQKRTEVMVTFLTEQKEEDNENKKVVLGMLKGKIKISDDFNEPLDDLKDYM